MNQIFKNLHDQAGLHASMVLDGTGQLIAHEGDSLYDQTILQEVSVYLSQALDSVDLLHPDWDDMHVQFADGSLMLRNLGILPNQNGRTILAVIGDGTLNRSFATIAMRVVAQKLKQALATGAVIGTLAEPPAVAISSSSSQPLGASQQPQGNAVYPSHSTPNNSGYALSAPPQERSESRVYLPPSNTRHSTPSSPSGFGSELSPGLVWSGVDNNKSSGFGVGVYDNQALQFLRRLSKSLAPYVGPMAKVFVKEAVQRVCQNEPFSSSHFAAVVQLLEEYVEDPSDCSEFINSVKVV